MHGGTAGLSASLVLLDLDGTLVDSAPGILGSLRAAFDELGEPWPGLDRHILGPPLYRSLPGIVGDEVAGAVLPVYRRHYAEHGLYRSTPYPGIDDLLRELAASGTGLALATSKAEVHARRILAEHGWSDLFGEIVGDTLDAQRPTKAAVVAEALRRTGTHDGAVMVGDRSHDVAGARSHGLDCLGAGWGYGAPGELTEAGAAAVFDDVAALRSVLLSAVGTDGAAGRSSR